MDEFKEEELYKLNTSYPSLMVLGKVGVGKSSLLNFLIKEQNFFLTG